jgi:hypothetical protein
MNHLASLLVDAYGIECDRSAEIERMIVAIDIEKRWGEFNSAILDGIMQHGLIQCAPQFTDWCTRLRTKLCSQGLILVHAAPEL